MASDEPLVDLFRPKNHYGRHGRGLALNLTMVLTFRLIGFGWQGGGMLLDPIRQSQKLIAVWTTLEPIPLVISNPIPIAIGLMGFGVGHALVYRWLSPAWPVGIMARAWRLASPFL